MLDRLRRLHPPVRALPLKHLALHQLVRLPLGELLTGKVGARRHKGPSADVLAVLALALLLALAAGPAALGAGGSRRCLRGQGGQLFVGHDGSQRRRCSALLSTVLVRVDLASKNFVGPLAGQALQLHGRREAGGRLADSQLHRLVDGLPLLQSALCDLHARGVQNDLISKRRVVLLGSGRGSLGSRRSTSCRTAGSTELSGATSRQRARTQGRGALLRRGPRGRQGRDHVGVRLESLLRRRLLSLLRVGRQLAGVFLALEAVQLHNGLELVGTELGGGVDDVRLGHGPGAVPLAELVQAGLGVLVRDVHGE
mmetsp:Transcript_15061/g.45141  ORF Transcript_15061/g.45141 Transcript_15061/m.45141 type:complete len:312 (-) Transcript_15061:75-1010(-)